MASITKASTVAGRNPDRDERFRTCQATVRSYRDLPQDWDGYGGGPAADGPIDFAVALLEELRVRPDVPVPVVCPIAGGVYIEWQLGDSLLFFEVDSESVLAVHKSRQRDETTEDPTFDVRRAVELASDFLRQAV